MKEAIKAFNGTVIIVSHDREFLDGLVEKTYEFANHKVIEHIGGIYDFLQTKKIESLRELEITSGNKKTDNNIAGENPVSDNKLSYEARKEFAKKLKKAEKNVEEAENAIHQIENRIAEIEKELEDPARATDESLFDEYKKRKKELEEKMYEWEILLEELESVRGE